MITDWVEPTDLESAEDHLRVVVAELQDIQTQLGDKGRRARTNDDAIYWKWRQSAKWALTGHLQDLWLTKAWIKDHRPHGIEDVARSFHEIYEDLAPDYSWRTQKKSNVPWGSLPENQRLLMLEVVTTLLQEGTIHVR